MATKIIHKKSSVASSIPAAGDLEPGEIAVNLADQKLYSKTTGGTVIELAPNTDQLALTETCKNVSGGSLAIGTPVYQSGTAGNAMEVQKALSGTAASMPAVGLLSSTLADEAEGTVVLSGFLQGLNTSTFSEGDTLYVSATGTLTTTVPAGEANLIQNIGKVIKVHASNGSVMVTGAGRANATPNLDDGNIFIGNASNQSVTTSFNDTVDAHLNYSTATSGQILSYDGSDYDWINAGSGSGMSFSVKTANYTLSANEGVITDTSGGAFTITLPASPSAGDTVVIADGNNWNTTNLVVGRNGSTIEGDADNMDMDIAGASVQFTYDGSTWQLYTTVGANDDQFATAAQGAKVDGIEAGADVTDTANVTAAGALMDSEVTNLAQVKAFDSSDYATAAQGTLADSAVQPNDSPTFAGLTVDTDTLFVDATNNRLGIGTTTPENPLHVVGNGTIARLEGSGGDYHGLGVQCSDASGSATKSIFIDTLNENSASVANMVGQVQSDGGSNWQWTTQPAGTRTDRRQERMRIDSSGNVGIGKNNPATPLDVTGTVTATAFAGDGSALTGVGGGIYESITSTDVTSSVATVEFDLDITTYKEFLFRIRDCIVETNNKYLYIQVSPDAGVTWRTTGYVGACRLLGINYTSTAGLFICVGIENGTNAFGSSIDTIIYNAGDSGKFTGSSSTGKVHHYNYGPQFQNSGAGYVTAETHNKMRVITNSGNITSGSFELMGELI
jgi:hypothetical protein